MNRERCRACCDWTAELADISLGDIFDPRGRGKKVPHWNSVIVRTEKGLEFIKEAEKAGAIEISDLEERTFYGNAGFEMKKHGGVFTLRQRQKHGWPVPNYHYEFIWQAKKREIYPVPGE